MDKSSQRWSSRTQNKGVNITSEEFPVPDQNNSDGFNPSSFPSLYNMKNQLQSVIDVMGPATPHLVYTTSSVDADNEESVISSASVFSSVLQIKQQGMKDQGGEYESPRDFSEATITQDSESLILARDFPQNKQPPQPICVPAVLPPAVLCMNPSCLCTHSAAYSQPVTQSYKDPGRNNFKRSEKKHRLSDFFEKLTGTHTHKKQESVPAELYKMNVMQPNKDGSPPRRFVFDLIDDIPKRDVNTIGTNTRKSACAKKPTDQTKTPLTKKGSCLSKPHSLTHTSHYSGIVFAHGEANNHDKLQDSGYYDVLDKRSRLQYKSSDQNTARVDVYYFDHGNAAYYRTTDSPPLIITELVAERTENYATKFWAELFGTIYIGFAFLTSFILQFLRFILHSIVRPLTIGLLQLFSDYFFKPFLATVFNALIQPPLIFFYNIATSLRDLCDPLAEGIGYYIREISVLCKSLRLFEIRQDKYYNAESVPSKCECEENLKEASK